MFRTYTYFTLFSIPLLACLLACGSSDQASEESYTDRMAAEHEGDVPISGAASEASGSQDIRQMSVVYATVGGQDIEGYLARPVGIEEPPGVVVIHEWWGLNDNIRTMTDRLAGLGYSALAVDLYGGAVAETPERARELMQEATEDSTQALENLEQAITYLIEEMNAPEIGTIGWCFGGGWSLNASLAMPERIDATVIYYGRLVTDSERLSQLESPVLGIFGAEDQGISVESVREFESLLESLGKPHSIHVYEGAGHAFANPSGTRYQPEASQDAWEKTTSFLQKHLKD